MGAREAAEAVLRGIGGRDNVVSNGLCMTRLRIGVANPTLIDREALVITPGVLGIASRGPNGVEVVFGPKTVRDVFDEFMELTGLPASLVVPPPGAAPSQDLNVSITATPMPVPQASPREDVPVSGDSGDDSADSEVDVLARMLSSAEENDSAGQDEGTGEDAPRSFRLLVINGPNINMLGIREPELYGREDYAALLRLCQSSAEEAGFASCECYQSNHEGDIVDRIQDAYLDIDGIVINPGAYTHTSVAILDALKAVSIPAVEVHISKVDEREGFRQVSYVRAACFETVMGLGIQGYAKAIEDLAHHLGI